MKPRKFEELADEWREAMECLRLHYGPKLKHFSEGDHFWLEWIPCPQCGRKPTW